VLLKVLEEMPSKDLEYLFQMTHAYFTDLNYDAEALKV
jgi:hypothetical protein